MDFEFKDREKEMKEEVAGLFTPSALAELEALEEAQEAGLKNILSQFLQRLASTGYLGLGLGPAAKEEVLGLMAVQEEVARISGSLFLAAETSTRLFGGLIAGYGGPDLTEEFIEPIKSGRFIGAVAAAEPGETQPNPGWKTKGRAQGRGYLVSGRKSFITNGPIADQIAVAGVVDDKPAFFLIRPGQEAMGLGPRMKTLGYNGLAVCPLELAEAKVPADRVLGPFNDDSALKHLGLIQDLVLTMASIGLMRRVLTAANDYTRTYHRGDKPIYAHQEVRFKLADMYTVWDTARLMTFRAGWLYGQGEGEARTVVSCSKVFAAESAEHVSNQALSIMAGEGYLSGNMIERGFRDAKYAGLAGVTTEVSRMNIADDLLGRYRV